MFPPTPLTMLQFHDTPDGLYQTAMAIELPNRFVPWHSNENRTPDDAYAAIMELGSNQVAHFSIGDGAVKAVGSNLDRELFDALISRNGQEEIPDDF